MPPIDNIIYASCGVDDIWIEESTEKIAQWRATFRSSYIAWAVAINGLFAAKKRYSDPDWAAQNTFQVRALRPNATPHLQAVIAEWPGRRAAEAHESVAPVLCAYGFMDMHGALEEFVFDMYITFLNQNPDSLIQGSEFKELRGLWHQADENESAKAQWEERWTERLEAWQKKKVYDGLDRIFLAYCAIAGIKQPTNYELTTPETWAKSIKGFALLRNYIAHGVRTVTAELASFSQLPYSASFDFEEGEELEVKLHHLQSIELFTNQLLSALNLSLLQRAGMPIPGAE